MLNALELVGVCTIGTLALLSYLFVGMRVTEFLMWVDRKARIINDTSVLVWLFCVALWPVVLLILVVVVLPFALIFPSSDPRKE